MATSDSLQFPVCRVYRWERIGHAGSVFLATQEQAPVHGSMVLRLVCDGVKGEAIHDSARRFRRLNHAAEYEDAPHGYWRGRPVWMPTPPRLPIGDGSVIEIYDLHRQALRTVYTEAVSWNTTHIESCNAAGLRRGLIIAPPAETYSENYEDEEEYQDLWSVASNCSPPLTPPEKPAPYIPPHHGSECAENLVGDFPGGQRRWALLLATKKGGGRGKKQMAWAFCVMIYPPGDGALLMRRRFVMMDLRAFNSRFENIEASSPC